MFMGRIAQAIWAVLPRESLDTCQQVQVFAG